MRFLRAIMRLHKTLPIILILILLPACVLPAQLGGPTPLPTATATPLPTPTLTPEPPAAVVNGEVIPVPEFESEVRRFEKSQTAAGIDLASLGDYRHQVLRSLIEERVAAQGSAQAGNTASDDQVQAAVAAVIQARGGDAGFQTWLTDNFYTEPEFRNVIRREILIRAETDAIAAQVPTAAPQVHARHILVATADLATTLLTWLGNGSDFAKLALTYSQDGSTRANGGDLGWFARGTLAAPEVEEAAFSLEPGQTSQVVQSKLGFHIVQTIEKADSKPLSPAALETLRQKAVEAWLAQELQKATIEVLV